MPLVSVRPQRDRVRRARARTPAIEWSSNYLVSFGVVGALAALLLLDTFFGHTFKNNEMIKAASYGTRTTIGVAVALFGMRALLIERFPFRIRLLFGAYVAMLMIWMANWALVQNVPAQIVLSNPSYSLFSWLLILAVPLMATPGVVEDVTKIVIRIPIWPMFVLLAAAVLVDMRGGDPYYPAIGNAVILLCAFRRRGIEGSLPYRVGALLLVAVAMAAAGVRAHAFVALFMIATLVAWPKISFGKTVAVVSLCLAAPLIYSLIIANVDLSRGGDMLADTRAFLFVEVTSDLDPGEMILGRGLGGSYFSPYFYYLIGTDKALEGDFYQRNGVEVAWLNIILKFGIIGLVLFVAIVVAVLLSFPKKAQQFPAAGPWRRVAIMMLFVFTMELPNQLNFHYLCWYVALGALLPRAPYATRAAAALKRRRLLPALRRRPALVRRPGPA